MAKDIIGRIQHFHMTPEIFLEEDQPPFRPFFLISLKFIIENLWICLTEAVNRLLDIPHHEAIVAIWQQIQHPLLGMVGILVLIDHDLMIALLKGLSHLWELL